VKAAYHADGKDGVVDLFHAVYTGKPRRGHTLITFENRLYDPSQSHVLSSASQTVTLVDGRSVEAGELRLSDGGDSRLVWHWYCVDHRCSRSVTVTKLLQAWAVLRGRVPRSSVWALSSPVGHDGADQARARLRAFVQVLPATEAVELPPAPGQDLDGSRP
jgi:EpsI family protein